MRQSDADLSEILIWAEQRDGQPASVALEILQKACELAGLLGGRVSAVVIGQDCRECAAGLIAHGAGRVFVVEVENNEARQRVSSAFMAACLRPDAGGPRGLGSTSSRQPRTRS